MFIFYRKKQLLLFFIVVIGLFASICSIGRYVAYQQVFKPIYQGNNAKKWVAFAVNVDWGEEYLDEMLKFFAKNRIKATFFITGRWAEANPDHVRKIANGGHEIGNHGYSHPHVNNLTLSENIEEINKTSDIILKIIKRRTKLYAPPFGEFNDTVLKAAHQTNHKTVLWTVDTIDWQKPDPAVITSRVLENVHNGAIILMHPTSQVNQALPDIFRGLSGQGYQVVPLENLITD